MTTRLDPRSLIEALTSVVGHAVPSATLHLDQGDDDYWCVSWRISDQVDRELFVEYPGRAIAPDVLRVGVYFRDAPHAIAAGAAHEVALEALTARRDALAALGAVCTFTPGASTRDDDIFAWATSDLLRWFTGSCANRDLVWRWDLRAGPPPVDHIKSVIHEFAPVWRAWNSLQESTT